MKLNEEYPKSWDKYRTWLKERFKKINGETHNDFPISDTLILTSVTHTPNSMFPFFDQYDLIGSTCYNGLENRFELSINGVAIEEESSEINHEIKGAKERHKAETILINLLMSELEKTL